MYMILYMHRLQQVTILDVFYIVWCCFGSSGLGFIFARCIFSFLLLPFFHTSHLLSAKHENVSEEVECEALMTLGHAALMRSDCEQAISFYAKVATPAAAWNQSQVQEEGMGGVR